MSSNQVKCPNCAHLFNVEEALSKDIETQIRTKYLDARKKDQEVLDKERQEVKKLGLQQDEIIAKKLVEEKNKLLSILKKEASEEVEGKIALLQNENTEKAKKLKELQEKEVEFLKEKNKLQNNFDELKTQLEKTFLEKQNDIIAQTRKQEKEQNELQLKELQKQLEDQKKLTEEMKRKQEQGSMQLQGEVQELALEALLKETFPFDLIEEVGKGVRGADCVQTVRNNVGQVCGKIIYESKRTQSFANDWIEKLKADMRAQNADIAVIVTQTMPKDMTQFGERNGIWICTYSEVRALSYVLRNSILKVAAVTKSQENKGDKMQLLYDYLTGNEFGEQWKAIREGFMAMKQSIDTERSAMERLWKAREKQLEKILLNASHISGSVEGISGMENVDLNLLGNSDLLE